MNNTEQGIIQNILSQIFYLVVTSVISAQTFYHIYNYNYKAMTVSSNVDNPLCFCLCVLSL